MSESTQETTTLYEQVEKGLADMPGGKGRRARRFWDRASEDIRQEICDAFVEECQCDCHCNNSGVHGILLGDSFDYRTPVGFDIESLEQLLQLILEYLPQIIALFSKQEREAKRRSWFSSSVRVATAAAVLLLVSSSVASAQCENGQCYAPPMQAIYQSQPMQFVSYQAVELPAAASVSSIQASPVSVAASPSVVDAPVVFSGPAQFAGNYATSLRTATHRLVASRPVRSAVAGMFQRRPLKKTVGRVAAIRQRFGILPRLARR